MERNHMLPRPSEPQPPPPTHAHARAHHAHVRSPMPSPSSSSSSTAAAAAAAASTTSSASPSRRSHFNSAHQSLALASPPSYAQAHDPALLSFPDVPSTELAPILPPASSVRHDSPRTLPSLSSVTGTPPLRLGASSQPGESATSSSVAAVRPVAAPTNSWPSLNPFTTFYTPSHALQADSPAKMDLDVSSNSVASASSSDRMQEGRAASVSLDDPDVRMAAEALGDLRADFVNSPPTRPAPLPPIQSPSLNSLAANNGPGSQPPEPLLALLTTSHPLLATTIEGATSAYNNSKNFSPRFKSGAEYVEGFVTPIANTVGSVGRVTGVEGGVRWFLRGGRRHKSKADLESGGFGSHKRRRMDRGAGTPTSMGMDPTVNALPTLSEVASARDAYVFSHDRRLSMASTIDSLPAYDEARSPAYTEEDKQRSEQGNPSNAAWQSRLIMSTSGLSVAMSEESLRSLKYCLRWLRWANEHIGGVIQTLKDTLEQYERAGSSAGARSESASGPANPDAMAVDDDSGHASQSHDLPELAAKITSLKNDVLKTLRDVIDTVSKYAGGALPDNARALVRRHLTSLPQRFRYATMAGEQQAEGDKDSEQAREREMTEGAQRVLVLAKEGLDMMAQVSGVLDGTIVSAEEWCERLGRKAKDDKEAGSLQVTSGAVAKAG